MSRKISLDDLKRNPDIKMGFEASNDFLSTLEGKVHDKLFARKKSMFKNLGYALSSAIVILLLTFLLNLNTDEKFDTEQNNSSVNTVLTAYDIDDIDEYSIIENMSDEEFEELYKGMISSR